MAQVILVERKSFNTKPLLQQANIADCDHDCDHEI